MTVAIVSDTHLPKGRRVLPDELLERCAAADLIVHLGDLVTLEVIERLGALGPAVRAVRGNVDRPDVVARLPARAVVDIGAIHLGLVHDAGPAAGRLERQRRAFPTCHAVLFGHSHIPLHESDGGAGAAALAGAFQLFNPGSATDRRRQPSHTMGIARITGAEVAFRHVDLGP